VWQDVGLDDEIGSINPRWLTDDAVRQGVKVVLELDRCVEEEARLRHEIRSLQEWANEEWRCIQNAKATIGVLSFHYRSCTLNLLTLRSHVASGLSVNKA
jgi:hypothetical protein